MVLHMVAATRFPRMAMTEPEARELSGAIVGYLRHTKLRASQKTADLLIMLQAVAMIEGTRVLAELRAQAAERAARAAMQAAPNAGPRVVPATPEAVHFHTPAGHA